MKKKVLSLLLVAVMAVSMFTACGADKKQMMQEQMENLIMLLQ